jgi:hypothetical protein
MEVFFVSGIRTPPSLDEHNILEIVSASATKSLAARPFRALPPLQVLQGYVRFHVFIFNNGKLFTEQSRRPHVQPPNCATTGSVYMHPSNGVTQSYLRHWAPISSPSITRRTTVQVF